MRVFVNRTVAAHYGQRRGSKIIAAITGAPNKGVCICRLPLFSSSTFNESELLVDMANCYMLLSNRFGIRELETRIFVTCRLLSGL